MLESALPAGMQLRRGISWNTDDLGGYNWGTGYGRVGSLTVMTVPRLERRALCTEFGSHVLELPSGLRQPSLRPTMLRRAWRAQSCCRGAVEGLPSIRIMRHHFRFGRRDKMPYCESRGSF